MIARHSVNSEFFALSPYFVRLPDPIVRTSTLFFLAEARLIGATSEGSCSLRVLAIARQMERCSTFTYPGFVYAREFTFCTRGQYTVQPDERADAVRPIL